MQVWVALEQKIFLGLSGPGPKRLLAPSLIDFRGKTGIRALYQAIGIPILVLNDPFDHCQVVVFIADVLGFLGPGSPDLMTELCPPQDTA